MFLITLQALCVSVIIRFSMHNPIHYTDRCYFSPTLIINTDEISLSVTSSDELIIMDK